MTRKHLAVDLSKDQFDTFDPQKNSATCGSNASRAIGSGLAYLTLTLRWLSEV